VKQAQELPLLFARAYLLPTNGTAIYTCNFIGKLLSPKEKHDRRWYEKDADKKGRMLRWG
jgi:hypothetical protein